MAVDTEDLTKRCVSYPMQFGDPVCRDGRYAVFRDGQVPQRRPSCKGNIDDHTIPTFVDEVITKDDDYSEPDLELVDRSDSDNDDKRRKDNSSGSDP